MKVQDGQIMGKKMKDSLIQKTTEQGCVSKLLCQRPIAAIREGRNKSAKWFTCLDCTTGWSRTPIPNQTGPPQGADLLLFGEVRFVDVPPGLHDLPTVRDVGHHDGGGVNRPSAFEVCSVFSVGERNLNTDAESTEGEAHQRERIRRHQSAGLVRDGVLGGGSVAALGSNVEDSGLGVPGAGSENTYPKHAILLLQGDTLQKELERPVPLIGFCGQIALGNMVPFDVS